MVLKKHHNKWKTQKTREIPPIIQRYLEDCQETYSHMSIIIIIELFFLFTIKTEISILIGFKYFSTVFTLNSF